MRKVQNRTKSDADVITGGEFCLTSGISTAAAEDHTGEDGRICKTGSDSAEKPDNLTVGRASMTAVKAVIMQPSEISPIPEQLSPLG